MLIASTLFNLLPQSPLRSWLTTDLNSAQKLLLIASMIGQHGHLPQLTCLKVAVKVEVLSGPFGNTFLGVQTSTFTTLVEQPTTKPFASLVSLHSTHTITNTQTTSHCNSGKWARICGHSELVSQRLLLPTTWTRLCVQVLTLTTRWWKDQSKENTQWQTWKRSPSRMPLKLVQRAFNGSELIDFQIFNSQYTISECIKLY